MSTETHPTDSPIQADPSPTEVGSYFISNYPPYSRWKPEFVPAALAALDAVARPADPLGLYIHIPFCRKRCTFCYFKVYTDKNAAEIERYLAALVHEMKLYSERAALEGRTLRFAYFGGGTPSYLSEKQLVSLVERLDGHVSWSEAEEVTFECEPGTLRKSKLEAIREIGVTRLSLGVENFNDRVLELNGRAHLSPEIYRAYGWAREVGFPQINIDLIAGMVGETEENWRDCVRRTLELEPDSVTVYQMELPYNTIIARDMLKRGSSSPVENWETKRRWVNYAFEQFEAHGFEVASATVAASTRRPCKFVYTDALWHGADMIGLGVASFSHFGGVHFQNEHGYENYVGRLEGGELPLHRAFELTPKQRLIRELILQLKTGRIDLTYFKDKFGADITEEFAAAYRKLVESKMLERNNGIIELTREGLLKVDTFLPEFFEPENRNIRYT